MIKNKWIWNQSVNLNKLTAANSLKVVLQVVQKFFSNLNNTSRALIGLCLLVTSQWGQIQDTWDSHVYTIGHIVIGLSLHIHSFIHLSSE